MDVLITTLTALITALLVLAIGYITVLLLEANWRQILHAGACLAIIAAVGGFVCTILFVALAVIKWAWAVNL